MEKLVERFIKYVKIDTKADPHSPSCPSTEKQFNLAKELINELNEIEDKITQWQKKRKIESDKLRKELNKKSSKTKKKARK